ncbi:MAG: pyridoxal phosphate-dependent aminotransferase [Chloroflexi bacterium]|jgi:aspartate aminotransferase|nr:pyridoxal phosphate-dependent aminotransferase [Chloroflexota bacterium]MBT7079942.1 pyridoxal phosphate-dependent aminotransferase [Chloroflexota bacterium]MBT7290234.1 pyridoxal phosphate-dependent aminotransferase [Chloroflexota bacterium]
MTISDNVRHGIEGSIVLKQKYGTKNVYDLSLGNPEMEPPAQFRKELLRLATSADTGLHRYMPNAGYPETREAVAAQLSVDFDLSFSTNDVVMTGGAAAALNITMKTLLNPGDEMIIFAPYFGEYVNYAANYGAVLRVVTTDETFVPKIDDIEAAISDNTKVVLANSPNNPSGVVLSDEFWDQLGLLLEKKEQQYGTQIYLISDEAYRKIIYDGLKYPSPLHHYRRSIIIESHSKDLALPGERIGYVAVHPDIDQKPDLINGLVFCMRALGYVNAPAMMQQVVSFLQSVTVDIDAYQKKRDYLYKSLIDLGYQLSLPQGAFYLFPKTPIEDDVAFVQQLQQFKVITGPGTAFGAPGYFRIAYCVDDRTLEGALEGFESAAKKFGIIG